MKLKTFWPKSFSLDFLLPARVKLMGSWISTNLWLAHQDGHFLILRLYFQRICILNMPIMIVIGCVYDRSFDHKNLLFWSGLLVAHSFLFCQIDRIWSDKIVEGKIKFLLKLSSVLLDFIRLLCSRWYVACSLVLGWHAALLFSITLVLFIELLGFIQLGLLR